MCSTPDVNIPPPEPPPEPPPPPSAVAQMVGNKGQKARRKQTSSGRGISALSIPRAPSVNVSGGTGVSI